MTTMELAILSGIPAAVEGLLANTTEAEALKQLTRTYGGDAEDRERRDDNRLYGGTTPILHAVLTGEEEMFSAVLLVMRRRMTSQQVMTVLANSLISTRNGQRHREGGPGGRLKLT